MDMMGSIFAFNSCWDLALESLDWVRKTWRNDQLRRSVKDVQKKLTLNIFYVIILGTAYVHGIQHATGDFIFILDADMSHHVRQREEEGSPGRRDFSCFVPVNMKNSPNHRASIECTIAQVHDWDDPVRRTMPSPCASASNCRSVAQ